MNFFLQLKASNEKKGSIFGAYIKNAMLKKLCYTLILMLFTTVLSAAANTDFTGVSTREATKVETNLVYQGIDKSGVVRYVGITERSADVRFNEHLNSETAKSLLQYRVIDGATGLTKIQARIWEQTLINQYGLQNNGGLLLNKINSISPKNWWQYGIK